MDVYSKSQNTRTISFRKGIPTHKTHSHYNFVTSPWTPIVEGCQGGPTPNTLVCNAYLGGTPLEVEECFTSWGDPTTYSRVWY